MKTFLSQLEWRYATKRFNRDKKVKVKKLDKILKSIQYAPTSFGLQPYHVFIVSDVSIREKIKKIAWDQPQIIECSALLVFCTRTDFPKRIDDYLDLASGGNKEVKDKLKGYEDLMKGFVQGMTKDQIRTWNDRQTYIALGFAMAACSELEIDACPIEGFDKIELDKILKLPEYLNSVVMLPIGYRDEVPRNKIRFHKDSLFTTV